MQDLSKVRISLCWRPDDNQWLASGTREIRGGLSLLRLELCPADWRQVCRVCGLKAEGNLGSVGRHVKAGTFVEIVTPVVEMLELYGDGQLAEDYMNCGQPDLKMEGRAWCMRRGIRIETGFGSNRANWGSNRD